MKMDEDLPDTKRFDFAIGNTRAMSKFYQQRPEPQPTSVMTKAIAYSELRQVASDTPIVRQIAEKFVGNPHKFELESEDENRLSARRFGPFKDNYTDGELDAIRFRQRLTRQLRWV